MSTKDSPSLRSCPFCGGEADIRQADNGKWHISTLRCGNGDISHHAHVIAGTKAEAIAAWNTRAAGKPGTFHDDFYDCESTVDAGEDTREKLEADVSAWIANEMGILAKYGIEDAVLQQAVFEWLDRQAALDRKEFEMILEGIQECMRNGGR